MMPKNNYFWLALWNNLVLLAWMLSCWISYLHVSFDNHFFWCCLFFMNFFCVGIDNIFEFVTSLLLLPTLIVKTLKSSVSFLVAKDKALSILMSRGITLLFFIDSSILLLFCCTLHIDQVILFDFLPLSNNKNHCRVHINTVPSMTETLCHWNTFAGLDLTTLFRTLSLLLLHILQRMCHYALVYSYKHPKLWDNNADCKIPFSLWLSCY